MDENSYHKSLGASFPAGTDQITLFIPSKDKNGENIDQENWTDQALYCFGKLFRGATAFPPGKGVWRNDEKGGELIHESTVMIVTYVSKADLENSMNELRSFLHNFGRKSGQGEVGIIINGTYYGISDYDD